MNTLHTLLLLLLTVFLLLVGFFKLALAVLLILSIDGLIRLLQ